MAYSLPTEFDLIVVGTGVVESIISAAASRIGKKVLQVDRNGYYGGHWASFNLEDIQNIKKENDSLAHRDLKNDSTDYGMNFFPLKNKLKNLPYFETEWHIPQKSEASIFPEELGKSTDSDNKNEEKQDDLVSNLSHISIDDNKVSESAAPEELGKEQNECAGQEDKETKFTPTEEIAGKTDDVTQETLRKKYRNFVIDLCPKLHFARGNFVELLISSNIARYTEFRCVSRVLTWINGHTEIVPCSRSDVFANNRVSVVEKRMLMKLLTSIETEEKNSTVSESTTYKEFLKGKKLSSNIIHFVLYALSMSTDETVWLEGIKQTKRFLDSLGRFGKTPFLFSMYGSGEITQAFCRLSAVFGGIFALNQPLYGIELDEENKFLHLICGTQKIKAPHIVMDIGMAPEKFLQNPDVKFISRGIFIIDRSLMESEKEHLSLLLYPAKDALCFVIELGSLTGACPKNLHLVHITSRGKSNPKEDLKDCVKDLFRYYDSSECDESCVKPKILWSSYFSIPDTNECDWKSCVPSNIFLCPGPDFDLDLDFSVQKAREIFSSIYPDEEFLPRAPDADEIVIEEDPETATEVKAASSDIDISSDSETKVELEKSVEAEIGIEARASTSDSEISCEAKVEEADNSVDECTEAKEGSK